MGTPPRPGPTALGFLLFLVQLHVQKCSEQLLATEGTPGPWGPLPRPALHTVLVLQGQPPPQPGQAAPKLPLHIQDWPSPCPENRSLSPRVSRIHP